MCALDENLVSVRAPWLHVCVLCHSVTSVVEHGPIQPITAAILAVTAGWPKGTLSTLVVSTIVADKNMTRKSMGYGANFGIH